MRQKCEECGDYKHCNEDSICFDCVQDRQDLQDWLPEDEEDESEDKE
jgi:ribosomal protein L32